MKMNETLKKLKEIEKEQKKIENKYWLNSKGMRPTWSKKDTTRFAKLRKEQKKLVGFSHSDILTVYSLVKFVSMTIKKMRD